MSDRRETFRHGLAVGGVAMLAGMGLLLFAVGVPDDLEGVATITALGLVAVTLLLAGVRDAVATVRWNRLAAIGIGSIAIYLGVGGLVRLLEGTATVWSLALLLVVPYFVWLAFECWVGGRYMDRELFVAE